MYATADMLLTSPQAHAAEQSQETAIEVVLVRAVLEGDRDGFSRLYDLYAPLVHGILLARVPRAEVDDLVQDIFLHAFKKLHTLRDSCVVRAVDRDDRSQSRGGFPSPLARDSGDQR